MRLYIEALNVTLVEKKFERMGAHAVRAKPVLDQMADVMMEIIDATFQSQGRRGGGSWKQLSDEWRERKLNARPPLDPRIGHATLALRKSMTVRGDKNQHLLVTNSLVRLSTELEYGETQQRSRPFIKFLKRDTQRMRDEVTRYLVAAWRRTRL